MYTTDQLIRAHQQQMRLLRKESAAASRKMRLQEQRLEEQLDEQRKAWRYEPPKPKRTPLPMRILSILF